MRFVSALVFLFFMGFAPIPDWCDTPPEREWYTLGETIDQYNDAYKDSEMPKEVREYYNEMVRRYIILFHYMTDTQWL